MDVTGHWALDAIRCVYESRLFEGVSGTEFAPDMAMTRGMFVTVLYRLAGEPEVMETAEYTDVAAGDWYAKAVAWAAKNGIVDGYGDSFDPNDFATRAEVAAILMRFMQKFVKLRACTHGIKHCGRRKRRIWTKQRRGCILINAPPPFSRGKFCC